jgi:alanine racemase
MNMMTVDVTNLESVKKDDEVVLIGSQNEIHITALSDEPVDEAAHRKTQ